MKKRLLSVFLSFCMILTLLPATALAAEEPGDESSSSVFQVGENTYSTLAEAKKEAGEDGTLTIIGEYSLQSGDSFEGLSSVIIAEMGSLEVPYSNATSLAGYNGNMVVEAGGALSLPGKYFSTEKWFGGDSARMDIESGSITISGFGSDSGVVWELSDSAEVSVPHSKMAYCS